MVQPTRFFSTAHKKGSIALEENGQDAVTAVPIFGQKAFLGVEIMDEFDSSHDRQEYAHKKWCQQAVPLAILSEERAPRQKNKKSSSRAPKVREAIIKNTPKFFKILQTNP
jgi:hypothetical protein